MITNHYHLLVGTPLGNISHFMQSVQTRYGGHFNMRHGRSGYVFQGPYGAKLVQGDAYLLTMSRYIHLNAVRLVRNKNRLLEEVVEELRAYPWSSYRNYIGRRKRKDWLSYAAKEARIFQRKMMQKTCMLDSARALQRCLCRAGKVESSRPSRRVEPFGCG